MRRRRRGKIWTHIFLLQQQRGLLLLLVKYWMLMRVRSTYTCKYKSHSASTRAIYFFFWKVPSLHSFHVPLRTQCAHAHYRKNLISLSPPLPPIEFVLKIMLAFYKSVKSTTLVGAAQLCTICFHKKNYTHPSSTFSSRIKVGNWWRGNT